jgi:hypothetical protein
VSCQPSKTCQGLLRKLKQGQNVLKKSIENIKPPTEVTAASRKMLSQRKLENRCRDSLTISLDRTSKFPKKRARLQLLSPEYEVRKDLCFNIGQECIKLPHFNNT